MSKPLDADRLEDLLEDILWAETSSKQASARSLAHLTRPQQDFVLHWVRALEKDNTACAYQLLTHAHRAITKLALPDAEAWIIQGLDVYDRSGLYAAVDVFRNVDKFLERARIAKVGATLEEHATILERIVLGLEGRRLALAAAETIHTDTQTLFLPATACRFETREDNFRFLKAAAAYLWAQTRFGTWRLGVVEALARFEAPSRALRLFHTLETLRLDARIARELPGIHRDMQRLNAIAGQSACPPSGRLGAIAWVRQVAAWRTPSPWCPNSWPPPLPFPSPSATRDGSIRSGSRRSCGHGWRTRKQDCAACWSATRMSWSPSNQPPSARMPPERTRRPSRHARRRARSSRGTWKLRSCSTTSPSARRRTLHD